MTISVPRPAGDWPAAPPDAGACTPSIVQESADTTVMGPAGPIAGARLSEDGDDVRIQFWSARTRDATCPGTLRARWSGIAPSSRAARCTQRSPAAARRSWKCCVPASGTRACTPPARPACSTGGSGDRSVDDGYRAGWRPTSGPGAAPARSRGRRRDRPLRRPPHRCGGPLGAGAVSRHAAASRSCRHDSHSYPTDRQEGGAGRTRGAR